MKLQHAPRYLKQLIAAPRNFKVDFVIAGTTKGGTTAFHDYLQSHPHICWANKKEVHFFNTDKYFDVRRSVRYRLRYLYYHSFFKPQAQHRIAGEATPGYMYWADSPRRIWQYNPEMKLIMILRNPVTRAYSHWNHQRDFGVESLSFRDAIEQEPSRLANSTLNKSYSYVTRGFYTEQLRRIWRFFPREQTLIFKTEELKTQPEAVLRKTHIFLGLEPIPFTEEKTVHARSYIAPLGSQEKEYLQNVYEYEIKALERMLDWDCSDWLK